MSINDIKSIIQQIAEEYSITKVLLFGSRADGSNREDSDIDLIIEFNGPVTLMGLARLRNHIEELTGLETDVIHGPIRETDMIEVGKVVELYVA